MKKKKAAKQKKERLAMPTQVKIRTYAPPALRVAMPKPKIIHPILKTNTAVAAAKAKAKAVKPPKKTKKQRKSLEGEEVEVMKTRSSEKRNQNLDTAIEKEGPGKGKRGRAKKSQKGADKSSDVMEVESTKGTDALNEDFLILDKDASVHSSEESMLSYDENVLEARRRQLEETNETKVSLFVCNSCREIFRSTVEFLNHERNCEKFRPVPFTKVQ